MQGGNLVLDNDLLRDLFLILVFAIVMHGLFLDFILDVVVVDLLKKDRIVLLKLSQDVGKALVVTHDGNIVCKRCPSVYNVIVLLEVKKIILLIIVLKFFQHLVLDDECHIADRETDIILEENPIVLLRVKDVADVEPKLLLLFRFIL